MRILKIKLIDSGGSIKKNNHYDFCKTPGKLTVFNEYCSDGIFMMIKNQRDMWPFAESVKCFIYIIKLTKE